jgi:hypothetical protein
MAVRKKRSHRPTAGVRAGSDDRMNGQHGDGTEGSWGTLAGPDQESMFMRRVLFSVLLAVVGLMGVWFLLTTLQGAEQNRRILSVTDAPSGVSATYTVKLLDFPQHKQSAAETFMHTPLLRQLAGPHSCSLLQLPSGHLALCVGEFDREDAPELQELLRRFREFRQGEVDFSRATILSYRE